uniref:Uncharacterized protein n=1 Tax=Megaselia scalaris TaxID=36166 RepID=T1GQE9_MEGSC
MNSYYPPILKRQNCLRYIKEMITSLWKPLDYQTSGLRMEEHSCTIRSPALPILALKSFVITEYKA